MAHKIINKAEFAELLSKAQTAHHDYQQSFLNGDPDADWAQWYGIYMVEHGISKHLDKKITVDELADRLVSLTPNASDRNSENWQKFIVEEF